MKKKKKKSEQKTKQKNLVSKIKFKLVKSRVSLYGYQ